MTWPPLTHTDVIGWSGPLTDTISAPLKATRTGPRRVRQLNCLERFSARLPTECRSVFAFAVNFQQKA
jgi:hypothetical protein